MAESFIYLKNKDIFDYKSFLFFHLSLQKSFFIMFLYIKQILMKIKTLHFF